MNIAKFVYYLNNLGFSVWTENESLSYRQYKENPDKNEILKQIKEYKSELIEFLKTNNCCSAEEINLTKIYRTSDYLERLSFAQDRLWFIDKYESGTNAYNIYMIYQLAPALDIEVLKASLRSVVHRHEILRTVVQEGKDGLGYQLVLDDKIFGLDIEQEEIASREDLKLSLTKTLNHIFDLSSEYPIKAKLIDLIEEPETKIGTEKKTRYLCIVIHHIAFDGWSYDILLRDLQEYYVYHWSKAKGIEVAIHLPILSIQYKDFALWQRNYLEGERLSTQLDYWKAKLSGYERLNLMTDKPRPLQIDYRGNELSFEVDTETSENLRALAKNYQVSLYSLLLSAYFLMLRIYSNQDDLIIGATAANRHYSQVEDLIGFFANTLVLRAKIESNSTIKSFIQSVGKDVIEAQLYQDLPFEKLVEELSIEKDTSQHPIFQVVFEVQSFGATFSQGGNYEAEINLSKLLMPYHDSNLYKIAKFDISTLIDDSGSELKGIFNYAESLFTEETIAGHIETYLHILKQLSLLAKDKSLSEQIIVSDIDYLNHARYKEVVELWNETTRNFPKTKLVHELFEEQVDKTPDRIAVVYGDKQISYLSLNSRANQLARFLLQNRTNFLEEKIALFLDRSEYLLLSILSVLKTGAAYVPIDPEFPNDRVSYILGDINAQIILTDSHHYKNLRDKCIVLDNIRLICVDDCESNLEVQSSSNLKVIMDPEQLAYIIYTSGTSGKPKGVMIEHHAIINRLKWMNDEYKISDQDVILQKTPYVFDVSVWELFCAGWLGAKLVFIEPRGHKDSHYLMDILRKQLISILHFVPSMLTAFLADLNLSVRKGTNESLSEKIFPSLKTIFCSGEELSLKAVREGKAILKSVQINNLYGPTETTVDVLYYNCTGQEGKAIPIGRPISNTKVYVFNESLTAVPVGAVGELYVGGTGLGRGYYNKPALTAERFIANPYQTQEDQNNKGFSRLYKTGDLVRLLADGNIEYLGRNDFQIKLRGYRIELGEIERVISSYTSISQSVVIIKEDNIKGSEAQGKKYLIGYYVSKEKIAEKLLESYLKSKLPDYMVPTHFVYLSELPLTINGKIDRKALPSPELRGDGGNFVTPRNEGEQAIAEVWSDVLGIVKDKISITDDFFRLGGDSIISIQLVSRLRQKLGLQISVKDIFSYRTIEKISDEVLGKSSQEIQKQISVEQGILSGNVRLLPIQEWFFRNRFARKNHWNQSFIVQVPPLSLEMLRSSLKRLFECHNGFRLRYRRTTTSYEQYYDETLELESLKTLDVRTLTSSEGSKAFEDELQGILTQWQSNFDIENGPLYGLGYINGFQDNSARIYFAFHHLIIDVVSWRILVKDLKELYEGGNIETKRSSYRQWSEAVKRYAESEVVQKSYWEEVLSDFDETEKSLTKLLLSEETREETRFILSLDETAQLLTKSNICYNTQVEDILLTALGLSLCELTGSRENHIVLEGHGREDIDDSLDVNSTVGWFTTIYPVRLSVSSEISQSIKQIKENLRKIKNKGLGYGAIIGYEGDGPRISFNYLGQINTGVAGAEQAWFISSDKSGESVHADNREPNIININCLVRDSKFEMHLVSKLSKAHTHQLTESFKRQLHAVIEHCVNAGRCYLTVSDVGGIASQERLDALQNDREIEGIYLANSLQQGFIYHSLIQGRIDDAYIIQLMWDYENALDVQLFRQVWVYAQARYPNLRLRFYWDENLLQIIDREGSLDWRYIDFSEETEESRSEKIKRIQEQDRREPYNLEAGNLFRVYLIKHSNTHYTCLFSNHHSILDGWSNPILLGYINDTYVRLLKGEDIKLEEDLKYLKAQEYLQTHKGEEDKFWQDYVVRIEEYPDLNGLLSTLARKQQLRISNYRYVKEPQERTLEIEEDLYAALRDLCQHEGITLNAVLQYVWHKVLSLYGNSKITTVGTVVSGRNMPIEGIESAVGIFINTLPMIVLHQNGSLIDKIKIIHNDMNEISNRSNVSLAALQKGSERIFDSLFIYENYPNPTAEFQQSTMRVEYKGSVEKLDYPLAAIVHEENNRLKYKINFAGGLFDEENIEEVLQVIHHFLKQIVKNPYLGEHEFQYLSRFQYKKIIEDWNGKEENIADYKTLHGLFEEQLKKIPDKIALVHGFKLLTYDELNKRANQLARYLREDCNVGVGDIIAIAVNRSIELIIGLLGTLKCGAAYVPLDINYPMESITYVLEETNAKVILIDSFTNIKLNKHYSFVSIDDYAKFSDKKSNDLNVKMFAENLAYIVYTSGSTGKPKGVMCDHLGVINRLAWAWSKYPFNEGETCALQSNLTFVDSTWDIFGTLLIGHKLIIYNQDICKDIKLLIDTCAEFQVTRITLVPSLFKVLLNLASIDRKLLSKIPLLRHWEVTGEPYDAHQASSDLQQITQNSIKFLDCYGASEATSIIYRDFSNLSSPKTHIISNTRIYIVDMEMNPLPVGAVGQILVEGPGLALGYLNKPALTAEKFIPNPFNENLDNSRLRLYKLGDLGRWTNDGQIELLGRFDGVIKFRAFRIEPAEIEFTLRKHELISDCIVMINNEDLDNKSLVAFIVPKTLEQFSLEENLNGEKDPPYVRLKSKTLSTYIDAIVEYLAGILPDYMVPQHYEFINKMPLNHNGKVERNALKSLLNGSRQVSNAYIAPRSRLEQDILEAWSAVLGVSNKSLGVNDNFFRVGGNSILAILLTSRLSKQLNVKLNVSSIFQHNTIAKLAKHIKQGDDEKIVMSKVRVDNAEEQRLSFAQERLWFIEKYELGTNAYNIFMTYQLAPELDIDVLKASLRSVVHRHDILRTVIQEGKNGQGYQLVFDDTTFRLDVEQEMVFSKEELDLSLGKSVNHIYDLSTEYPIKVKLIDLMIEQETGTISKPVPRIRRKYLSIIIHHIAFDGWSNDIFLRDLQEYYAYHWLRARGVEATLQLPILSVQYRDFALWQRNYLRGDRLRQELDYWKTKLFGYERLNLITDKPRPLQIDYRGDDVAFEIDKETSDNLRDLAKAYQVSLYSLLLSAYYLMLRIYSNQDDLVVGTTAANRHYSQIEDLVGFFANTLVLRAKIKPSSTIKSFVQSIGEAVIEAQLHQDLPFEKLVEELALEKDTSQHPIFQVLFEVQSFGY